MSFENIDGKSVPKNNFKLLKEGALVDLTHEEVFAGKRVVIFAALFPSQKVFSYFFFIISNHFITAS